MRSPRENFGTAIVAGKNSKVTIIDSNPNGGGSITGGYDNNAGALHIYENAEVKVENVTFAGNHANKQGGAIFTKGSPELNNCTFTDNSGADGGAVYVDGKGKLTVDGTSVFTGNKAVKNGGGAITNHGSLRVKGTSIFDGNSAKQNGGAIRTANYVEIAGATIVNNKTASSGGGISMRTPRNKDSKITNCIISNNEAGQSGGGIHTNYEVSLVITASSRKRSVSASEGFCFSAVVFRSAGPDHTCPTNRELLGVGCFRGRNADKGCGFIFYDTVRSFGCMRVPGFRKKRDAFLMTASRCRINFGELPYILFAAAFSVLEFRRKICYN